MPSPVGHSIIAAMLALKFNRTAGAVDWTMLAFLVFSASLADLDFIPGMFVDDFNRFHRGASHSVTVAVIYGLLCGLLAVAARATRPGRWLLAGTIAYGSHLVADLFATDPSPPFGIPLFWPVIDTWFVSPVPAFLAFDHGDPGDGFVAALGDIFSVVNLAAVAVEVIVLGPVLLVLYLYQRRRR